MNTEEKIKLEFDLLCWKNFYDKCHELEDAVQVCDSDDNEGDYIDITERDITYNDYISNKINDINIEKTLSNDYKKYDAFIKKNKYNLCTLNKNITILEKEVNSKYNKRGLFNVILSLVLPIILIFAFEVNFIIGIIIGAILSFINDTIFERKIKEYDEEKENLEAKKDEALTFINYSFIDWLNKINNNKYNNTIKSFKNKYLTIIKEHIEPKLFNDIEELRKIKNELKINCPLPEKYQDEFHVNALLSLVLDGRADTLKEAINLFEEEMFRYNMIKSLDMLNYNLVLLNKNIDNLKLHIDTASNYINSNLEFMISQNYAINNNLTKINYQTNYLMVDALFD